MTENPKKIDAHIIWVPFYCKHCSTCINICPVKNLEFKDDEMASLGKCTQCELCQKYCPDFAIEVEPRAKKESKDTKETKNDK